MRSRIEGQIWIDRNSPNRLKYFVNGQEYEVSVAQNYEGSEGITRGCVVALKSSVLSRAVFPEDTEYVIGIAGQTYVPEEGLEERTMIPILRMDNLILDEEDIKSAFIEEEIEEVISTSLEKKISLVGAPLYWFIGRTLEDYSYLDSTYFPGKLTLCTPSGFRWGITEISDNSLNVGYTNLPILGTIADYKIKNKKLVELKLNINYSGFESSIEWTFPYLKGDDVGKIAPTFEEGRRNGDVNITIRHGLFPYNKETADFKTSQIYPRCFCEVVALNENDDTEYRVSAAVDNYYGLSENEESTNDRRTEIYMKTDETLRYSISGKVVYKFNKTFKEGD